MSDWLFDHRTLVYLLFGITAVVLVALWWRARRRPYLVGLAVVIVLAAAFGLFDLLRKGETDREQIERALREMAAAAKAKDADRLAAQLSPNFVSPLGNKREEFSRKVIGEARARGVQDVELSDLKFEEVSRSERTAKVRFLVRVKATAAADYDPRAAVEAVFRLDADGRWRLQGYKVFFPPNTREEQSLPF